MSHSDKVEKVPKQFLSLGYSDNSKIAAIQHKKYNIYGLQFHPEVTHTSIGKRVLSNFIDICKCKKSWTPYNICKK